MATETPTPTTFREHELAGWNAKAATYGGYAGSVTAQLAPRLVEAVRVGEGAELIDIACGPGYTAQAAVAAGARVTGIDFAPGMVAEARRRVAEAEFRQGDAERLAFPDAAFDAAICAFGIGHFAEPDRAIAEAFRVLRRGGRYAFSWWCAPDRHEFFGFAYGTVKRLGSLEVPLPPAPRFDRFSDPEESVRALRAAGFGDAEAREHHLSYEIASGREVLELIEKSTVRLAMLIAAQQADVRARIETALVEGAEAFRKGPVIRFGFPAIVASARKA